MVFYMAGKICSLCKENRELRYSHILPEFLYLNLYELKKHRVILFGSSQKVKFIQKGIREHLLCQECETKLSRYEGYTKRVLLKIPEFSRHPSGKFIFLEGVNCEQFKIFQLSILWRASVSQNPMFMNVNLGKHEEKIRCMLNEENPGKFNNYGSFIVIVPNPKKVDKILLSPMKEKLFGHTGYIFMTGNLFWYFIVSSHPVEGAVQEMFLQESDLLRIWMAPWNESEILTNIRKALM